MIGVKPNHENVSQEPRKAQAQGSIRKKCLSGVYLGNLLKDKSDCCKRNCIRDALTVEEIDRAIKRFHERDEEHQRLFILDYLFIKRKSKNNGKSSYSYEIEGKDICLTAWKRCHGISNGRFHNLKKDFEDGRVDPSGLRSGSRCTKSKRAIQAELWFEDFVESMADRMPHEDRMHLPSCMTKKHVYFTYRESMLKNQHRAISQSQFRRMWDKDFKHVTIPKENRFTKCGVCTLIKEYIHTLKRNKTRISWSERKNIHLRQQAAERAKFKKHQNKARKNPKKYVSIICDGMDQSKTNLPHFKTKSKLEGEHGEFLNTHITGVLSHGHDKSWCFIDMQRWPGDANPTMHVLLSVLKSIVRPSGTQQTDLEEIAPVLYWQMDNCWKDCKNIFILGFCAFLVKAGVFRKVRLSYLMVGHTHEDVDQMFSKISVALRRQNAATVDALRSLVRGCYTPEPLTVVMENIYDLKSWIRPYVATLKNHSSPHAFRFTLDKEGNVQMSYRLWANGSSKTWLPENRPIVLMTDLPEGKPALLRPENTKNCSPEDMSKSLKHLKHRLTKAEYDWWERYVSKEKERRRIWQDLSDEDYAEAGQAFDISHLRYTEPELEVEETEEEDIVAADAAILRQMNKEAVCPEVKKVKGPVVAFEKENAH